MMASNGSTTMQHHSQGPYLSNNQIQDATLSNSLRPSNTSGIDPMAILKRVEDLRRWQEEEKKKLLQAHEDQLQQLRLDQERFTKLISSNETSYSSNTGKLGTNTILSSRSMSAMSELKVTSDSTQNPTQMNKLSSASQVQMSSYRKASSKIYEEQEEEEFDPEEDYENEEDKTKTDFDNQKSTDESQKLETSNIEDYDDNELSEQDLQLVRLISNQIKMQKINLDAYVDDEDDFINETDDFLLDSCQKKEIEEALTDSKNRLSTILEVSCEESPFKRPLRSRSNDSTAGRLTSNKNKKKLNDFSAPVAEMTLSDETNKQPEIKENEEKEQENESREKYVDVDSIQIGVKPTNKMTFEDLIEEKLRQAEIENDYRPSGKKKGMIIKKKNSVKVTSVPQQLPHQAPKIAKEQEQAESLPETITIGSRFTEPHKFLKRGEGLKKYQPKSKQNLFKKENEQHEKTTNQAKNLKNHNTNVNQVPPRSVSSTSLNTNSNNNQVKNNNKIKKSQSSQNVNILKKNPKTTKEADKKKEEETLSKEIKLKPAIQVNTTATPVHTEQKPTRSQIEIQDNQNEDDEDDEELKEFEELEQYVEEHPSFRSTVSAVETFISTKKTDNPNKFSQMMNLFSSNSNNGKKLADLMEEEIHEGRDDISRLNEEVDEMGSSVGSIDSHNVLNGGKVVLRKVKRIQIYDEDEEELKIEEENNYYRHNGENIRNFNLNTLRNISNTEIIDMGLKKQYSCMNYKDNSDHNDFDPNDDLDEECQKAPKTSSRSSSCDNKKSKFDDANSWVDNELTKRVEIMERQSKINEETINNYQSLTQQQTHQQPTSQLVTKLFPALKQTQSVAQHQQQQSQQQKDKEAFEKLKQNQQNQSVEPTNTNATLLKQKLSQLETEIERFQKKNAELVKLKEKCESEFKLAEVNRKLFEKQKEEEFLKLKEVHDEEMRKLRLDKKIFEQYKHSLKENPDRKERDEIERIRKQLNELQEDMKQKETRWIANNNRLKERIEILEQEKLELKKELQLIEKQRIESLMMGAPTPAPLIPTQTTIMQRNPPAAFIKTPNELNQYNEEPRQSTTKTQMIQVINNNKSIAPTTLTSNPSPQLAQHTNIQQYTHHQPNTNLMLLKRSTSEKSLSSSTSSSCSSSSSASIGSSSTGSSINPKYYQSTNQNEFQQIQQPQQLYPSNESYSNINNTRQYLQTSNQRKSISPMSQTNSKTVKFQLDYGNGNLNNNSNLIPGTSYDYEKDSSNTNSSNVSSCSDEYMSTLLGDGSRQLKVAETRCYEDKHVEKLLEDGTTITIFPNGTIKECSPDKRHTYVKFFNGDRKEMNNETSTETYFYAETNITQIIYSNGMQILKFPSGQIEKHHTNKTREIIFPDKICKFIYPDGSEESRLPNGTVIKIDPLGGKVIEYPNKQREIHTKEYKRREYPDGSIKTVYTNGISETRYANGRVRVKDSHGNIISDKK